MKISIPPKDIPEELYSRYTMGGTIPVLYQYCDDSPKGEAESKLLSEEMYARAIEKLIDGTFKYYGNEWLAICEALDIYSVKDKIVLIWGLVDVNCDAIAIWKGAKHVYVVDYNSPICEHEKITVLTHEELKENPIYADFAISYSSFEHDGLGRYGDVLNPDGDLSAMQDAHTYLKDDGLLLLGLPTGPDCLGWNGCRFYGPKRLPLVLKGWQVLDVFNAHMELSEEYPFDMPIGSILQFSMILQKIPSAYPSDEWFEEAIQKAGQQEKKVSRRSFAMLERFLKVLYHSKQESING